MLDARNSSGWGGGVSRFCISRAPALQSSARRIAMPESPCLSLLIPAFNEREAVGGTIREARSYFDARGLRCEIIVPADGDDGTRELVSDMSRNMADLKVIGQPERRGKGRGIREAVALATGIYIGYTDADNKVPIEEFGKVEPYLAEGFHVVIGSRAVQGSQVERYQPIHRRLGGELFRYLMQAVVGVSGIRDTQCGFKFFPRAAAVELFRLQRIDGYMFDVEILALAIRLGMKIQEVPIRWRDDGDSRLELLRGNLQNLRDLWRIRRYVKQAVPDPVPHAADAASGQ